MKDIALRWYEPKIKPEKIVGYAQIDDEDYDYLSQSKWYLNKNNYAYRVPRTDKYFRPVFIMMHREIMRLNNCQIKGFFVDHKDGNRLNNQKSNLRICTDLQNNQNKKHKPTKNSPFKGVKLLKKSGLYRANIMLYLGTYPTAEKARDAYNEMAAEIYGEFANTELQISENI